MNRPSALDLKSPLERGGPLAVGCVLFEARFELRSFSKNVSQMGLSVCHMLENGFPIILLFSRSEALDKASSLSILTLDGSTVWDEPGTLFHSSQSLLASVQRKAFFHSAQRVFALKSTAVLMLATWNTATHNCSFEGRVHDPGRRTKDGSSQRTASLLSREVGLASHRRWHHFRRCFSAHHFSGRFSGHHFLAPASLVSCRRKPCDPE